MRLTLRTLLAYLDDILEPADAESIGQKIHDSDFATQLVARIRDVTRRLRLTAPKPHGRGLGADANTVAEYLDNTLPAERIPEFERICLESDSHLAEVAASHQILTLALGTPAEVPSDSRQRMYALGDPSQAPVAPAAASAAPAAPGASVYDTALDPHAPIAVSPLADIAREREPRPRPEVPEYLRGKTPSAARWLPIVAAVVVVVLLSWVILQAIGPLGGFSVASNDNAGEGAAPPVAPANDAENADAAGEAPAEPTTVNPDPAPAESSPVETPLTVPTEESPAGETPAPTEIVPPVGTVDPSTPAALPSAPSLDPSVPPVPGEVMPDESPPEAPVEPGSPVDVGETPSPDDGDEIPLVTSDAEPAPAEMPVEEGDAADEAVAPAANGIGRRVATGRDIMLRWNAQGRQWGPLPAAGSLFPGDYLLTLPAYRSTLTLGVGANLQLIGPARLGLELDATGRIPGIVLSYGRVIIMSAGRDDMQIGIAVGDRRATMVFGAAETTIAIEVRPRLQPGVDPSAAPTPLEAHLYVTSGELTWRDASGAEAKLAAPAHELLLGEAALVADDSVELPGWTTGVDDERSIDQRAANSIRDNIEPERDIVLNLKELASDRRPEVASLAARGLAYLDEFGPLVATLNDSAQRAFWTQNVKALDDALGRGPETATLLRASFEKQRGEDGLLLYRLLYGYNTAQLQGGAASELVELLDHEDLDLRVLSIAELTEITGTSNFYRPEKSAQERESLVQRWRQKLTAGEIVPKPAAN